MVIFQDPSTRSLIHNKVKQSTLILYQPESLLDKKTGIITEVRQMLEIRFVRASPEIIKADLLKRNAQEKIAWVDEILAKDARSRELKVQTDELRRRRNTIAREINESRKAGKDPALLMKEAAELPGKIKENDAEQDEITNIIRTRLMRLPNILDDSVPGL